MLKYPRPLDNFTNADQFTAAINTIDTALYLILHTQAKLPKKSSIDAVQLACVKELESLKAIIQNHPNYSIFQEAKKQEALKKQLEQQGGVIENDEQLLAWLDSIIPQTDTKLRNKDLFRKKFVKNLLSIGKFEDEIMYGQYEKNIASGCVLAVLDMRSKWDAYIIIVNVPYGYSDHNLLMYKLEAKYTKNKDPIKPSIILADNYLNPQELIDKEIAPSS